MNETNKNKFQNELRDGESLNSKIERLKYKKINEFIYDVCSILDFGLQEVHFTNILYEYALERNFNSKWSSKIIACVCIYISSRKFKVQISLNEIADASKLGKSDIAKAHWILHKSLDIESTDLSKLGTMALSYDKLNLSDKSDSEHIGVNKYVNNEINNINIIDNGNDDLNTETPTSKSDIDINDINGDIYNLSTKLDLPLNVDELLNSAEKRKKG